MRKSLDIADALKRPYKMRAQGEKGLNTVVSIPRQVITREAVKRGITIKEFIKKFKAVAHYDSFDGIFYAFEEVKPEPDRTLE